MNDWEVGEATERKKVRDSKKEGNGDSQVWMIQTFKKITNEKDDSGFPYLFNYDIYGNFQKALKYSHCSLWECNHY